LYLLSHCPATAISSGSTTPPLRCHVTIGYIPWLHPLPSQTEIYLFRTVTEWYAHTSMISAISYVFGKGIKERNYDEI
jgi:hypothetical protein